MAKKKDAHHGGAWKVAYADFVTAMMALFLVLWICAQEPNIVLATSQYFKNPFLATAADATSGVLPFNNKRSTPNTSSGEESGTQKEKENQQNVKLTLLNSVAADFYRLLHLEENMAEAPIDVEITADGLRVTVFDRGRKPLFVSDTAELTEWGRFVMQNLAWVIDRHRFRVVIDGHTRSGIVATKPDYSAWELSSDRALAARRALVHYAVDDDLIERVTGYGDTHPVPGVARDAEANQRITVSLSLSTRSLRDTKLVEQPVRKLEYGTKSKP
ncbi:flagellar motor protein MotB [Opitutus sp. ER46]|uniref:OmpA/MotB family protein n=1 Tax=Opitutus sp. ER46 TaxID=2161864 RepID=UPI000D30918A|nr:flagellar motor protein MotB [Opitutus sp. ER46]PTX90918.1 flagellar motor protein MotB [Opitutus sp. ER46]